MKPDGKPFTIIGALVAPTVCGALITQLYYVFRWKAEWLTLSVYALCLIAALICLYRLFPWPWWKKVIAAIPFIAISLVATVYVCLMVAAAHGDAL